ncbi:MAG: hypothetical protein JWM98_1038 [Thermoleophilia bacterium]|nr:hypothetical protein [Thermoleophilia bacterium]
MPPLAAVALAAWAALSMATAPATAFTVQDRGTAGLDGKVVMSPAAERIETVEPGAGEQISPGSVVHRSVIIHNRTKAAIDFDLDVAQVVGSTADLIVEVRHGVHEGAAAWVTLEKTSFRLKPGQQGTVGVTIKIPQGIKPGSKPFAVTATQRGGAVQTQGAGIAPQFKQVGIFILELPGDAPINGKLTKASITSAQKNLQAARDNEKTPSNSRLYVSPHWTDTHRLTLSTEYQNKGERLLTPSGKVVIRDIFGRVAGRYDIKQFTVYPDGESAGTVELKGLPSLGVFTARVELESEAAGKQTTTLPRFVMVPKWFLLAAAAFILYGLYRLLRWQLRRRREWKRYLAEEEARPEGGASGDGAWDGSDGDGEAWEYEDDEAERA